MLTRISIFQLSYSLTLLRLGKHPSDEWRYSGPDRISKFTDGHHQRLDLGLGGLFFWPSMANSIFSTHNTSCPVLEDRNGVFYSFIYLFGKTRHGRHLPVWHNLDDPEWGFLAWGPYKLFLWNANMQKLRLRMPYKTWLLNPQMNLCVKQERERW